jgi:osmoprotectant transport system permease protein
VDARHVSLLLAVARWLLDPAHYQGSDGVPARVLQHLELSAVPIAIAVVLALPLGLVLGHTGRLGFAAVNVANVGRALPSLAFLGLGLIAFGLGFWPAVAALVPLAIPPILTSAYVAVRNVDRDVVEAAHGMGLGEGQILTRIELPLALPLVLAGLRTAAVNVVATATLGAVVATGGLGRYLVDGFALQEYDRLAAGALLVAVLAVAVEAAFAGAERAAVSPGIRRATTVL